MRALHYTLAVGALGLLTACGDDSATEATQQKAQRPAVPVVQETAAVVEDDFRYDPTGKTDPFKSFIRRDLTDLPDGPTQPLEKFDISQLVVTGIIWGAKEPRALVTDPSGKGYIVSPGAAIGKNKGRVVRIDDNRVVVKETYVDFDDKATTGEVEMLLYERHGG